MKEYYKCPECGYLQRSNAIKLIKCHRCGKSYEVRKALKIKLNKDHKAEFFRYVKK